MRKLSYFFMAASMGGMAVPVIANASADNNSGPSAECPAEGSDQFKLVSAFMQQEGQQIFSVLDKHCGELRVVENGKTIMQFPALYGRGKGDDYKKDSLTTPAGIFNIAEYYINPKEYDGGLGFAFLVTSGAYMIHPTWHGDRSERRDQRLASATPDDNKISKGCINISADQYEKFSGYIKTHYKVENNVMSYPSLAILPEDPDLAKTRVFFHIPNPKL